MLLVVLVILGLFTIVGCGSKIDNSFKTNEKEEKNSLKIGNVLVDLTRSGSFHDISYKYPENVLASNVKCYEIGRMFQLKLVEKIV